MLLIFMIYPFAVPAPYGGASHSSYEEWRAWSNALPATIRASNRKKGIHTPEIFLRYIDRPQRRRIHSLASSGHGFKVYGKSSTDTVFSSTGIPACVLLLSALKSAQAGVPALPGFFRSLVSRAVNAAKQNVASSTEGAFYCFT
jgi:hypothetical protein